MFLAGRTIPLGVVANHGCARGFKCIAIAAPFDPNLMTASDVCPSNTPTKAFGFSNIYRRRSSLLSTTADSSPSR